jgi:hypothetical protein
MAYLEIPLSNFIGHSSDIIETLYAVPEKLNLEERDDTELIMNLKPIDGYKPTRDHKPSTIWNKELEGIFGSECICILDPYYLLYIQLVNHISEKFDEEGIFKYCFQSKDDEELVGVYELTVKEDITEFLTHIIQTVPCSLYEIELNLGLKPNSTFSVGKD